MPVSPKTTQMPYARLRAMSVVSELGLATYVAGNLPAGVHALKAASGARRLLDRDGPYWWSLGLADAAGYGVEVARLLDEDPPAMLSVAEAAHRLNVTVHEIDRRTRTRVGHLYPLYGQARLLFAEQIKRSRAVQAAAVALTRRVAARQAEVEGLRVALVAAGIALPHEAAKPRLLRPALQRLYHRLHLDAMDLAVADLDRIAEEGRLALVRARHSSKPVRPPVVAAAERLLAGAARDEKAVAAVREPCRRWREIRDGLPPLATFRDLAEPFGPTPSPGPLPIHEGESGTRRRLAVLDVGDTEGWWVHVHTDLSGGSEAAIYTMDVPSAGRKGRVRRRVPAVGLLDWAEGFADHLGLGDLAAHRR